MTICEECGSRLLAPIRESGVHLFQCGLCGALAGDSEAVAIVESAREARERGLDPAIHTLVRLLEGQAGLRVVASSGGDPEALIWPFVQMSATAASLVTIENLAKSLRLAARGHELHWIIEVEFTHGLVFTLKPRFHRSIDKITPELVRRAAADLERIRNNLTRDQHLSWWQRPPAG